MNKPPQLAFYPGRLIFIFPILFIGSFINDDFVRLGFVGVLAFITSRMFPIIDKVPTPPKEKE